ncbi:uncharacterized protein N7529_006513 [Penicillium soppii]|jgi:hypothetical protein|uniref:uncharacterized protein n=1 Tax=Penicillium soppii TaxID=69789 RepID=UPI00254706C2|nr:uncharacterized protein N7529_006513 [Penicillium soppii]KAJ5864597.1 hypothetical protein N7529_006513 [Penicillium soppii]
MTRQLLEPIQTLLQVLTNPDPNIPNQFSSAFTTSPKPVAYEHGLPQLAPFVGRSFTGQEGISTYFNLLSTHLEIKNMAFESEENWVIDESCMSVALRGTATFIWKKTRQAWSETFAYRIKLAEDVSDDPEKKGCLKVSEYQVWADTGAAYLASLGKLDKLREV